MFHFYDKIVHLDEHRHLIDRIADVNAIISGIALYPQLYKLLIGASSAGLSFLTFAAIGLSSILWIIYGIHRQSLPILVSSAMNGVAAIGIVGMIVLK